MKKDSYHIIGVMSGTSLDGVDLCYVNFRLKKNWDYNILNTITSLLLLCKSLPFSFQFCTRLAAVFAEEIGDSSVDINALGKFC